MDYDEAKQQLETRVFTDIHALIGTHRSKEENIVWWGDTIALEGTYTASELRAIADILDRYREDYIQLRNEID